MVCKGLPADWFTRPWSIFQVLHFELSTLFFSAQRVERHGEVFPLHHASSFRFKVVDPEL